MKTSDIPDKTFLAAVLLAALERGHTSATRWDVAAVLAGHPDYVGTGRACEDFPAMPWKIVLSKAKTLIRRKLLEGCGCGCRGDFELPGMICPCPACGRRNWHHLRGSFTVQAPAVEGDDREPGTYVNRECYHCGHPWTERVF